MFIGLNLFDIVYGCFGETQNVASVQIGIAP